MALEQTIALVSLTVYDRPLDLLEAAYRLDGSDAEWLGELLTTTARVFAREDLGAGGYLFAGRVHDEVHTVIDRVIDVQYVGKGVLPSWRALLDAYPSFPPAFQHQIFFAGNIADTSSSVTGLGEQLPTSPGWIEQSGFDSTITRDAVGLVGHASPLSGVVISPALRQVRRFSESERRLWRRIAIHLGTALRLRRNPLARVDAADAVLSPEGRVEHLASDVDDGPLKDGFARRHRARGRQESPQRALEIWQGLHDGRWSLVDHVDTDGKSFVLAVRNEPAREVASRLTDGQRAAVALAALGYGNKQIAYALGLSVAAVGMLLTRARLAVGARSRAQLVQGFRRSLAEPS
jgi:DNA-binding CsgD family transcriptional regulator